MANEYYSSSGMPQNSGPGLSVDMRAELAAVQAGFDKLPTLTGNALKLVMVNAGATGLTLNSTGSYKMAQSWTPVLTCGSPGDLAITYSTQSGSWHQLGQLVCLSFELVTSAFTWTTASGAVTITGLPTIGVSPAPIQGSLSFSGITKANYTQFTPYVPLSSVQVLFNCCGSGQSEGFLQVADLPTAGTVKLAGSVWYLSQS